MRKTHITALGSLAIATCVFAAFVDSTNLTGDGSSGTDYVVTDSSNSVLPSGTGVSAVGYFRTLSDQQVAGTPFDQMQTLVTDFEVVATDPFAAAATEGIFFACA